MRTDISALYVDAHGPYPKLVTDWWDEKRDARLYAGPNPVVAHPPCERWGRYWGGGPSAKRKYSLGDDNGCFGAALAAVNKFGGVLEHPEGSHAFRRFGLAIPNWREGWRFSGHAVPNESYGYTCCVAQGNYGHPSRKLTWLYLVTSRRTKPSDLDWSIPIGMQRLEDGFHDRAAERPAGIRRRISRAQMVGTPTAFAEVLLDLAASARVARRSA